MARPDFTRTEEILVSRILEPDASSAMFEAAYLVPAAVLVAIGFIYDALPAFAAAFAVILAFRIWHVVSDRRYLPVLREIIRKYERACDGASGEGTR
jgi:hypothetical protein